MNDLEKKNGMAAAIEQVVIGGDLSRLSSEQRVSYVNSICTSLGLNPTTRPFEYITLSGKLTLYATRACSEQLRKLNGVTIFPLDRSMMTEVGLYQVIARGKDATGREDESSGVVTIAGLKGEMLANAMLKCETKAKRRLTLSICGLGFLDETEVSDIPNAKHEPTNYAAAAPQAVNNATKRVEQEQPLKIAAPVGIAVESKRAVAAKFVESSAVETPKATQPEGFKYKCSRMPKDVVLQLGAATVVKIGTGKPTKTGGSRVPILFDRNGDEFWVGTFDTGLVDACADCLDSQMRVELLVQPNEKFGSTLYGIREFFGSNEPQVEIDEPELVVAAAPVDPNDIPF
jgi:hypothetical protein